jgi:predicted nucleic acid-binding protein
VKVLLDVNVLADLFLKREAWLADAAAIWDANRTGRIRCCALASNIDTLAYLVRRNKGEDALAERDAVRACLESLEILVVTADILRDAVERNGADFEDDILISAAVAHAVDAIVTRDGPGFVRSPVDVHEPRAFARIIAQ